jgi:3-hydroxyacyl-[acyl-carrier-protein] dehydratase
MKSPLRLEIARILEILPHRYPFVLVDRVDELVKHERIVGRKMVSANEPWCTARTNGRPIMPGVLILEALTQLGTLLAYASEPFDTSRSRMYFLGIDKAKFRHTVTPGDRLDLQVTVIQHRSNVWKLRGEATVESTLCAQAELLASIVDND